MAMEKESESKQSNYKKSDHILADYNQILKWLSDGSYSKVISKFIREDSIGRILQGKNSQGTLNTNWMHLVAAYGAKTSLERREVKEAYIVNIFEDLKDDIAYNYTIFDLIKGISECPQKAVCPCHTIPFCLLTRGYETLPCNLFSKGFYLTPVEFNYLFEEGKIKKDVLAQGIIRAIYYYNWRKDDPYYRELYNKAQQAAKKIDPVLLQKYKDPFLSGRVTI